jgi:CO/xanthine dehydrogenase Mo-binding subunit
MNGYQTIGRSIPRGDGSIKVTGAAMYSSDLVRPGMFYGRILFSDRPHARLVKIDARAALALPGVAAVITSADAPQLRFGVYLRDRLIFAADAVRCIGEPVAAVAATSQELADRALDLIAVAYEDLPPLLTPEDALAPDAPLLHPDLASYGAIYPYIRHGNVCMETWVSQGDVEAGFAEADRIFEGDYSTGAVHQAPIEPHACLAEFDATGKLTVWTSTQQLSICHSELAAALGVPMTEVRVIPVWLGGGFGGKLKSQLEPICALLARAARRPVKLQLTREEEFTATHGRAPFRFHLRSAVKNDGTLLAKEVDVLVDAGPYSDHTIGTTFHACTIAQGPYRIPNCRAHARVVYTNNPDWGCMRGYGAYEAAFATEAHMDVIAAGLGIDPVDLRLHNLCREGDVILSTQALRSVHIRETMETALAASGYRDKKGRLGPNRGIGVANLIHGSGFLPSSASVRVNEDGTVAILTAVTDVGTGSYTAFRQIVAEILGLDVDRVRVASPDSESSPYDTGSIGSRTIYDGGNAVRRAAEAVRAQITGVAAQTLGCSTQEIVLEGGRACCATRPDLSLAFADANSISLFAGRGPLIGSGSWLAAGASFPEPVGAGYGAGPLGTFLFGTHVAEVEVDPETGQTRVLRYTACHDAGTVINPDGLAGQIEGGVVQGIGSALYEESQVVGGRILNANFADYRLPTVLDVPEITVACVEVPDPTGPFGAKGIGETPIMPVAPAIANAILDATGVAMNAIPITAERLHAALGAVKLD